MLLLLLAVTLIALTRWPLSSPRLYSFDAVNFALALREFNPALNQPQPPGYPFFVLESRLLRPLFGSPETTFLLLRLVVCGLAVGMLYLLGRRMFSPAIGAAAAALLFVNPPFWYSGLTSPLRPHLALLSILVAYGCWRVWNGEEKYFGWASLALGISGGFRPDLVVFLTPLWLWTAWQCRQRRHLVQGALWFGGTTLLWLVILVVASGGAMTMLLAFSNYLFAQTHDTSVLISTSAPWRRTAGRAVIWTALGAVPWLWALPFGWAERRSWEGWGHRAAFLALWFLPGFLFHFSVHIGDPDHALPTIPALCLLGGFSLWATEQVLGRRWFPELIGKGYLVWIALVGNLVLFFGQFPLPQREAGASFRGWSSLADAVLIGTYESSYARFRWVEQMADLGLREIARLDADTQRPVLVIWARDGEPVWRKISYYLPRQPVYVLEEREDPGVLASTARLMLDNRILAKHEGTPPLRLPVPENARLIWVVGADMVRSVSRAVPLQSSSNVYYTDLAPGAGGFRWGSFEFVPERAANSP
ncbi:MAG TPA: glycosyltransferase family 39 protein [Terriglobia bacterium]|nr:glycosyltransferase family 39 protein [Terriglobia bacterium]